MDTTWNVFPTDSTISYDVDTTIHEYSMDTTSTYYDETGIKMNDSIYLQIDSTLVKKYTAYDSTISVIDTLYMWKTDSVIYEGTEEYIISGFRKTGYPEDE